MFSKSSDASSVSIVSETLSSSSSMSGRSSNPPERMMDVASAATGFRRRRRRFRPPPCCPCCSPPDCTPSSSSISVGRLASEGRGRRIGLSRSTSALRSSYAYRSTRSTAIASLMRTSIRFAKRSSISTIARRLRESSTPATFEEHTTSTRATRSMSRTSWMRRIASAATLSGMRISPWPAQCGQSM